MSDLYSGLVRHATGLSDPEKVNQVEEQLATVVGDKPGLTYGARLNYARDICMILFGFRRIGEETPADDEDCPH